MGFQTQLQVIAAQLLTVHLCSEVTDFHRKYYKFDNVHFRWCQIYLKILYQSTSNKCTCKLDKKKLFSYDHDQHLTSLVIFEAEIPNI